MVNTETLKYPKGDTSMVKKMKTPKKINKKDFERQLYQKFGRIEYDIGFSNVLKNGEPTVSRTYLYYHNNKHIGSWQNGKGWVI